ncbi:MAG TPA: hypothetical protein VHL98_11200 [Microvirga sp.]|jgi:hypothetical protein|nr:hypothetical protein [Microvirga sp.]
MSAFRHRLALILRADLQEAGNKIACALGYDVWPGKTYSVPLSEDGQEPATAFGCSTAAQQAFVDALLAAHQGQWPDAPWEALGLTADDLDAVTGSLIMDAHLVQPGEDFDASAHFDAVAAAHGLKRIVPASPFG